MDAGVFRRTRRRLALWIAAPPLLIAGMQAGITFYCLHIDRQHERTTAAWAILPALTAARESARAALTPFPLPETPMDIAPHFSGWINRACTRADVALDTLSIQPLDPAHHHAYHAVRATLTAHGPLAGLLQFLDDTEHYHVLACTEQVTLRNTAHVRAGNALMMTLSIRLYAMPAPGESPP